MVSRRSLGHHLLAPEQGCGLSCLGVEILHHCHCCLNCSLGRLGIRNGRLVLGFGGTTLSGCISHCRGELFQRCCKIGDVLGQLGNCCFQIIDVTLQDVHFLSLLITSLLVGGQFSLAPSMMLCLLRCLLHQLGDEVLNHLLHLSERIGCDLLGDLCQQRAATFLGTLCQKSCDLSLNWAALVVSHLEKSRSTRGANLDQSGEVLLTGTSDVTAADDLNRFLDGIEL